MIITNFPKLFSKFCLKKKGLSEYYCHDNIKPRNKFLVILNSLQIKLTKIQQASLEVFPAEVKEVSK